MALLPQYSPFFKYRGSHDIYFLGYNTDSYTWTSDGKHSGSTDYVGYFIYNPQSTNGSTGKIIKGDFCIHGVQDDLRFVAGYAQQVPFGISVKLWCHDRRLGTNPNDLSQWRNMTSFLRVSPNNTTMKISTYWNDGAFIGGVPRYGITIRKNGSLVNYDVSTLRGLSASEIISRLKFNNYTGHTGFEGTPYFMPEPVGYRYHSNNGNWSSSSPHVPFYYDDFFVTAGSSKARSDVKKSKLDGGGGNELEYKFIFDSVSGVGLDYFRLQFTSNGMSWYFPQKPIFADYNKIDNPMLSVPDFCNRNDIINWPNRYDAMSYYYDGTWKKYIPLFKFYNGTWTCF